MHDDFNGDSSLGQRLYYEQHDLIELNSCWEQQCVLLPSGYATTNPDARNPIEKYELAPLSLVWTRPVSELSKHWAPAFLSTSYAELDARIEATAYLGFYHSLAIDIDSGNVQPSALAHALNSIGFAWVAYPTYSSKDGSLRWRVFLPSAAPWLFDTYRAMFFIICDLLFKALGVTPDKCSMRGRQIAFLPNGKVDHVKVIGRPELPGLDSDAPQFKDQVAEVIKDLRQRDAEHERVRSSIGDRADAPEPVQKFNAQYATEQILELSGYTESRRPASFGCSDWRSPYQTSGTHATRVYPDGRWVSLSMSDFEHGVGPNNGKYCFGDAFDLWVHYQIAAKNAGMTREQAYAQGIASQRKTPVQVEQSVNPAPAVDEDEGDSGIGVAPKPLGSAAKIGLVGRLLALTEDRTEATEAAIVSQFLAFAGTLMPGRRFVERGGKHFSPLYVVVVGRSSKGRKGTAKNIVTDLFHSVSPGLIRLTASNVVSGEGLLHKIRDPRMEQIIGDDGEPVFDRFRQPALRVVDGEEYRDPRLLLSLPETVSLFNSMGRDKSTLSPILREAFDGTNAIEIVRRDGGKGGDRCENHQIGVCGNITPDELALIPAIERRNGFANRCLYFYSSNDRIIPSPERISFTVGEGLELSNALGRVLSSQAAGEMFMTTDANDLWNSRLAYDLEVLPPSVQDFLTRQRGHCLRVAMVYALLDGTSHIDIEHLYAAEEILRYARDTVIMQFGTDDPLGDDARHVFAFIKDSGDTGVTGSELYKYTKNSKYRWDRDRSDAALTELANKHRITSVSEPTRGRPVTRYRAV